MSSQVAFENMTAEQRAAIVQENMLTPQRWAREYPELGTGPVPIEPCISPEYYELEREYVFKHAWLNVGRVEEIPRAGDYLVKDIVVCNTSILIARGKDGQLQAFHNMCSHRGNKLVWDSQGSCKAFRCKFHGWTFDLQGRLAGVTDEKAFFNLNKEENGLTPVSVDTWEGFIFINMDPRPEETLAEFMGEEIPGRIKGFPFHQRRWVKYEAELKCNWKVLLDAFSEGYHGTELHKRSIPAGGPPGNKYFHPALIELYKRHRFFSQVGNPDAKPSPTEAICGRYQTTMTSQMGGNAAEIPGTNPLKTPLWNLDVNVIFPNFWIGFTNGLTLTYNFWPLAVDRMVFDLRLGFDPVSTAAELVASEMNKVRGRDADLEDLSTVEQTYSVLTSGAKTHFNLGDSEIVVRHGYKVLQDYIDHFRLKGASNREELE